MWLWCLLSCWVVCCVDFADPNDADLAFVQFLKSHSCYDLIPNSSKLVIFDTHLTVMVFPLLLGISCCFFYFAYLRCYNGQMLPLLLTNVSFTRSVKGRCKCLVDLLFFRRLRGHFWHLSKMEFVLLCFGTPQFKTLPVKQLNFTQYTL